MRHILIMSKYTYKNLISSKGIWFTMLMPFIMIIVISLIGSSYGSKNSTKYRYVNEQQVNQDDDSSKDIQENIEAKEGVKTYNDDSLDEFSNNLLKTVLPIILSVIFYLIAITYSAVITNEVAKEKGSKLLEFIFSSIDATKFFIGKMLGIVLVILTNLALWAIGGFVALIIINRQLLSIVKYINISPMTIILILVTWFLGMCIYLSVAGMLGAMVSKLEDASKAASPIIFVGMIFYFLSFMNLDMDIVKILSFIPFAAPFMLPKLIIMNQVEFIYIIVSILILIITTVTILILSTKSYKKLALNYNENKIFTIITMFARKRR